MNRNGILTLAAIVVAATVAIGAWSWLSSPGVRDSDGDGVPDATDAFPQNPSQTEDSDGDGYGDDPEGQHGDDFPDDALEWADSDDDGVGDNADVYDQGNGAVRVSIKELSRLDNSLCDGDPCDIIFRFRVDLDGSDPFGPTCVGNSSVFVDVEYSLTEPGSSLVCDVDERAAMVLVEVIVQDDGGTVLDYHPNAGLSYITTRVEFPPSGYYSIMAAFPYDGPPIRLDWRAEIVSL